MPGEENEIDTRPMGRERANVFHESAGNDAKVGTLMSSGFLGADPASLLRQLERSGDFGDFDSLGARRFFEFVVVAFVLFAVSKGEF
jgi:hypothetical protein